MSGDGQLLRTVICGCGRMGHRHARALLETGRYAVVGVSDLDEGAARDLAGELPESRAYADLADMLAAEQPEVAVITTPGASHAGPTVEAAEAGVRGICCEKPMATCLKEGRAMVESCREHGVALIVNHQRRMGPDLVGMRRLIEEGALGDVYLIRGTCAGDMLGDGSHLVNSIRWLAGDEDAVRVLGQVYRKEPDPDEPRGMGHERSGGWRYGYPVETGAVAVVEFRSGLRAEMLTGELRLPGRAYQDYEVFGTEGRLWRPGDSADPPVLIWDERAGGWRRAPIEGTGDQFDPMLASYRLFARSVRESLPHPLAGESVLKGLEVIMAVHESARLRRRVELPLQQEEFPLKLMIESDQL